jgi:hypothetical protein
LAQHDVDELVTVSVLADRGSGVDRSRGLRDSRARDAEGARLVLVDLETKHLHRLVPVVIHAAHVRVAAHHGLDFVGVGPDLRRFLPDDPKLHRVRHRRPIGQQLGPATHFRKLGGEDFRKPQAHFFA